MIPEIERIQEGITGRESVERLTQDINQWREEVTRSGEDNKVQKKKKWLEMRRAVQDILENWNMKWMKKMKSKEGGEEETRVLQTWVEVERREVGKTYN